MYKNKPDFKNFSEAGFEKPVTAGVLADFFDDVMLPGISRMTKEIVTETVNNIVEDKINTSVGSLRYELKEYIDKKLTENTNSIFDRLDHKFEKDKQFKTKEIELFKTHHIGTQENMKVLEGLV